MEKNFKKGERVWIWYQSFIPPTYGDYIFVQATIIEREYDAETLYPEEKYIIRADSGADAVQSAEYIYRTKEEAKQGLIEYFDEYKLKELLLNLGSFSDIFETRGEAFLSIQKDIHDWTASNLGHTFDAVIRENKYKPITELLLIDLKDHCG